jgi:predicted aconitase
MKCAVKKTTTESKEMKAPEITKGEWESSHDGHGGIYIGDHNGRQIGFVSARREQEANAKLLAAALALGDAAAMGHTAESGEEVPQMQRAAHCLRLHGYEGLARFLEEKIEAEIAALKAAGYTEAK